MRPSPTLLRSQSTRSGAGLARPALSWPCGRPVPLLPDPSYAVWLLHRLGHLERPELWSAALRQRIPWGTLGLQRSGLEAYELPDRIFSGSLLATLNPRPSITQLHSGTTLQRAPAPQLIEAQTRSDSPPAQIPSSDPSGLPLTLTALSARLQALQRLAGTAPRATRTPGYIAPAGKAEAVALADQLPILLYPNISGVTRKNRLTVSTVLQPLVPVAVPDLAAPAEVTVAHALLLLLHFGLPELEARLREQVGPASAALVLHTLRPRYVATSAPSALSAQPTMLNCRACSSLPVG